MAETRQTGDERNRTNPGEFGRNRTNGAKRAKLGKTGQQTGIFTQKRGKRGKKWAKSSENGQKMGKNGQKNSEQNRILAKQGETESFAKSWFGFGHPCSAPPLQSSPKVFTFY